MHAISQMMILLNELEVKGISQDEYDKFMTILAPLGLPMSPQRNMLQNLGQITMRQINSK